MGYSYPTPSLCSRESVQWRHGALYIDGAFQLDEWTSHIYHECLVSLPLCFAANPKRVLILGGGDGCAAKEALKFPSVDTIVVVDYNPNVTQMAKTHPSLLKLNGDAFSNQKVEVIHTDAVEFVKNEPDNYWDAIILDFTATTGDSPIDTAEFHDHVERILVEDTGVWSRVMDFPWKVATTWARRTPVRYFDVPYPTPVGGEAFLIAVRSGYGLVPPQGMKYLTTDKVAAFKLLPRLTSQEATARAAF